MPAFAFDYDNVLHALLEENGLAPDGKLPIDSLQRAAMEKDKSALPDGKYDPREHAQKLGLNPPTPCRHGSGCNYNGCCAFPHAGEEGSTLKYFPERTRTDPKTDELITQKAAIRLVNEDGSTPSFYARRRQNLSWETWCSRNKVAYTPNRPAGQQGEGAPRRKPSGPPANTWASVAGRAPAPPPHPVHPPHAVHPPQHAYPYPYPPYSYYPPSAYPYPYPYQQPPFPGAYYPYPPQQQQPHRLTPQDKQDIGNKLFPRVQAILPTLKEGVSLKGRWPSHSNLEGKVTGMLLEMDDEDIRRALADNDKLTEIILDACEILFIDQQSNA